MFCKEKRNGPKEKTPPGRGACVGTLSLNLEPYLGLALTLSKESLWAVSPVLTTYF